MNLEPELPEMMRDLHRSRRLGCPYVFNFNGRKVRNFRVVWRRACRKTEVPGMLFHDFRRTAIRNMIRVGIPERVAMAISGHKTRGVFERYNIVSQEDLQDLKETARKRQAFREEQSEGLQSAQKQEKGCLVSLLISLVEGAWLKPERRIAPRDLHSSAQKEFFTSFPS